MSSVFSNALVSAVLVALGLFAYDRLVIRPSQRLGIVDVAEVYRLKEAEFAKILTSNASEAERTRALSMASEFAKKLPEALEELPAECKCLVIVKSTVIGTPSNSIDLTNALKFKVGIK